MAYNFSSTIHQFISSSHQPWFDERYTHQKQNRPIIFLITQSSLLMDSKIWIERGANYVITLPDLEAEAKSWETVQKVIADMIHLGCTRESEIWALGGGVVGDVSGFIASIILRGIRLIHIPTTLLAQIDSSIGGKNGINIQQGKNLIGTFYAPSEIWLDFSYLTRLPKDVYQSGIGEVLKYSVLNESLFHNLKQHASEIIDPQSEKTRAIFSQCIKIKQDIINQDPFEQSGQRVSLNLGHTFAHAIETHSHYTFPHGKAVGIGVCLAAWCAHKLGLCTTQTYESIVSLAHELKCLESWPDISPEHWYKLMKRDKKNSNNNQITWILPIHIGTVQTVFIDPSHTIWNQLSMVRLEDLL
jgi:3-dehydroquinate synthase